MATTWHPTIAAHEVHAERREHWDDKNPNITVLLMVAASDADSFCEGMIANRYFFPSETTPFYLRCIAAQVVPDKGCYTSDVNCEMINTVNYKYVTLTYATDIRIAATMCQNSVLITERLTPHVEFLSLPYESFQWSDGDTLISSDASPAIPIPSFKVNMIVERFIDTPGLGTGSGGGCLDDIFDAAGCVNSGNVQFYTFYGNFPAETVLLNVEGVTRSVMYAKANTGIAASDVKADWYHTLQLSFTVRKTPSAWAGPGGANQATWNRYYRVVQDAANKNGWYEIYHKPRFNANAAPLQKLFYPSSTVDSLLL